LSEGRSSITKQYVIVRSAASLSLLFCSALSPFSVFLRSPRRKIVTSLFEALLANSTFLLVVINDNLAVPRFLSSVFTFLAVFTSVPTQLCYVTAAESMVAVFLKLTIPQQNKERNKLKEQSKTKTKPPIKTKTNIMVDFTPDLDDQSCAREFDVPLASRYWPLSTRSSTNCDCDGACKVLFCCRPCRTTISGWCETDAEEQVDDAPLQSKMTKESSNA
jgi:hypothetical protein